MTYKTYETILCMMCQMNGSSPEIWMNLLMCLFLHCFKGEAGASGIPGVDGREGHPVSQTLLIVHLCFGCLSCCYLYLDS